GTIDIKPATIENISPPENKPSINGMFFPSLGLIKGLETLEICLIKITKKIVKSIKKVQLYFVVNNIKHIILIDIKTIPTISNVFFVDLPGTITLIRKGIVTIVIIGSISR